MSNAFIDKRKIGSSFELSGGYSVDKVSGEIIDVWDPSDYKININDIKKDNEDNVKKYQYLVDSNNKPRRDFLKLVAFTFVVAVAIVLPDIRGGESLLACMFYILFFTSMPVIIFAWRSIRFTKDLLKLRVAHNNQWVYAPSKNYSLQFYYAELFPEIFNKSVYGQYFEDMFWGNVKRGNLICDFVSGNFVYLKRYNKSNGKVNYIKINNSFFVFKLSKKIKSRFLLKPDKNRGKENSLFWKKPYKELNVESSKFNELFSFEYAGSRDAKELDIVSILSPRIQEELVKLGQNGTKNSNVSVLFTDQSVVFSFDWELMDKVNTNFMLRSLELDPRDVKHINDKLDKMINISTEVVKYID